MIRTADPQGRQGERCERRSKAETVRARTAGGACVVLGSYAMGERSTRCSGRRQGGAARTSPLRTPPAVVGRRACECLLQQVQSVAEAAGEIDWDIAVDSTTVGAHQHAAGDRTDPAPAPAQRGRATRRRRSSAATCTYPVLDVGAESLVPEIQGSPLARARFEQDHLAQENGIGTGGQPVVRPRQDRLDCAYISTCLSRCVQRMVTDCRIKSPSGGQPVDRRLWTGQYEAARGRPAHTV